MGAVAVVAGVGANVLNVVLLGSLPETATRGWISYGMAGLNPFMNVESNGRAEQNLASIDELQRDRRMEYTNLPHSSARFKSRLVTSNSNCSPTAAVCCASTCSTARSANRTSCA